MTEKSAATFVVLAAFNLEGDSPGVISSALDLVARHDDAELHVLAVITPFDALFLPSTGDIMETKLSEAVERLRRFVSVQVAELLARAPDAGDRLRGVEVHCSVGRPANEIVWLAAHLHADLVVVGTHDHQKVRRLLLGSVAEKVSRLAGCPVLVVREKHHAAPWRTAEIEPICADCAESRRTSGGATLWCTRHLVGHARAHVVCRGDHGAGLSPLEAVTGI